MRHGFCSMFIRMSNGIATLIAKSEADGIDTSRHIKGFIEAADLLKLSQAAQEIGNAL